MKRICTNRLIALAEQGLAHSACDISDGGIAVALAEACFGNDIGAMITLNHSANDPAACLLFAESATRVIVTCATADVEKVRAIVQTVQLHCHSARRNRCAQT